MIHCFAWEGLAVVAVMDQKCDAYTQIKAIISDSSFLQEYKVEYVKYYLVENPHYIVTIQC